jgi:hypothetical protein
VFVQGRAGGLPSEFNDRHVGYCLGSIDCRSSILRYITIEQASIPIV